MLALLDTVVVLGFPALAVWAVRTGGLRRLWIAAASSLAAAWTLALVASSVKFGTRLTTPQGYGKTALLTVLMATLMLGLPLLGGTLAVHAARRWLRHTALLYLLAVVAALVALALGTGLAASLTHALAS
jgi:hypothetical protein